MTATETEKLRTLCEINKRQRRTIDRLKEALRLATEAAEEFDRQSNEVFALVHENRQKGACTHVQK